jgi:hypothetical protein
MQRKKIFIVTSGEYSDYHIEGVFSTKKLAEEFVATLSRDARVEEYALDEKVGWAYATVHQVYIDLETGDIASTTHQYPMLCAPRFAKFEVPTYRVNWGDNTFRTCGIGKSVVSRDHAIKIAVEGRQKWLREQQ